MDPTGAPDTEDELGPLAHLAPSPQSEAVAYELQELSLQSSQYLPPLNERKNGERTKSAFSVHLLSAEEAFTDCRGISRVSRKHSTASF